MATATRSRKVKAFACKLVAAQIEIAESAYQVEPIPAGESGTLAFRLSKRDGEGVYDVVRTHAGLVECDCPDYEVRHRGIDCGMCRHGKALVELRLMPAPRPVPNAAPDAKDAGAVPDQAPPRVEANVWARLVTGKCWEIATDEQRDLAVEILNQDGSGVGRMIVPPGPSLVAPCCAPAEPEPCLACTEPKAVEPGEAPADDPPAPPEPPAPEEPSEPSYTLAELADREVERYRAIGTPAALLFARTMEDLAASIRTTQAATPEEFEARLAVLEEGLRETWEAIGYEEGRRAGYLECCGV